MKNVLILGCGSVGRRHINNMLKFNYNIHGFDTNYDRLNIVKNKIFNFENCLNKPWDGVVICSPPSCHIQQAIPFLKNNIPLFMEKPLSTSLTSSLLINNLANEQNFLMGYTYRFWKPIIQLKKLIESNEIGQILHINACIAANLIDWHPYEDYRSFFMSKKELGGGALLDESHILDIVLWFFGFPKSVFANIRKISNLDINTDDNVDVILYYDKFNIVIHLDLYSRPHKKNITITGENGNLIWNFDRIIIEKEAKEEILFEIDRNDMFIEAIEYFNKLINKNLINTYSTYQDGCNVMKLIEFIRLSDSTGERIEI